MASTRRKSAAIALAVVGIAGLALASAAQLTVNTASLGAGVGVVASCDDEVDVTYTTNLDAGEYVVDEITVSDIAEGCAGQTMQVAVDGTEVFSGVLDASGSETFAVAGVTAADLTNIAIVIAG
jgi:hypothetical protein